jgi:hypothetical protein
MEENQNTQQVLLDFFSDEFLNSSNVGNGLLDNATLAAICNLDDTCGPSTSAAALKRPQEGTRSLDDSEDEDRLTCSKRGKGDAAKNKANREKARREKMNDRSEVFLVSTRILPALNLVAMVQNACAQVQRISKAH